MADDTDGTRRCPRCGEKIASVTIDGPDGAILFPCGHEIPAGHPVLTTEDDDDTETDTDQ